MVNEVEVIAQYDCILKHVFYWIDQCVLRFNEEEA